MSTGNSVSNFADEYRGRLFGAPGQFGSQLVASKETDAARRTTAVPGRDLRREGDRRREGDDGERV